MRLPTLAVLTACIGPLAAAPGGALAQGLPLTVPLDSGRLVRLHLDDGSVVRGRLLRPLAPASAEISFCRYPAPACPDMDSPRAARLHAALVTALEVTRETRLWRGVAIGAGIGAVLGGLLGSFANGMCDEPDCDQPLAVWILGSAAGTGVWGALIGSQIVVWGPAP